jgi:hypothetical protein
MASPIASKDALMADNAANAPEWFAALDGLQV